ncbi:MAG: hypothetical protein ABSE49_03655 [Polyangiaceae bacterium]|jgi:hypothetical protein
MDRLLALALLFAPALGCAAQNEVLSLAADDLSCPSSHLHVDKLGASSYLVTGCGQAEQYTCERQIEPYEHLACARDSAGSAPLIAVEAPAAPPPLLEPPTGAGGFTFGATEDETRRACEQAGHTFAHAPDGSGTCDGEAADIGARAHATIGFCEGRVCGVTLQIDLAAGENPARALVRWKAALVAKYGGPSATRADIPSDCEADVTTCLADKSGAIRFYWQWPSRVRIALWPQVDDAQRGSVRIAYIGPRPAAAKAPGL